MWHPWPYFQRLPAMVQVLAMLSAVGMAATARAQTAPPEAKSSPEAVNVYSDAANFQNNGAWELAVEEWTRFLNKYPKDPLAPKARHYLGVCQQQLNQLDAAAASFQKVLADYPQFELLQDTYLNLGRCQYTLAGKGKPELYDQAAQTFAQLAHKYPQGKYVDEALFYCGEALYARAKKREAVQAYQKLVSDSPQSGFRCRALYALGVTLEDLGDHNQAEKIYDEFLKGCATSDLVPEVRLRKAEMVLAAGKPADAEKLFADVAALEAFPHRDRALLRQAFAVASQNHFADAAALYARLPLDFPESEYVPEAAMSAGRCYYRAEKFSEAQAWLDKVVAAGGQDAPEAAHWVCRIQLRGQEPKPALALAERVLPQAGAGSYAVPLEMDRADALYAIPERRAESLKAYMQVASQHPDHALAAQALYYAAFTALELKQYGQSLKLADQFLAAHAQDQLAADVRYVASECHLQQNELPQAEAGYRQLLSAYPQHADVSTWQLRLALALYLQKKYADVVTSLDAASPAFSKPVQKAEAHFLVGASQFFLDRLDDAAASLAASVAADTGWRQADEALLFLSRVQRKKEKTDAALATVRQLIDKYPQSEVLDQAYYRLGEYRYAAEQYAESATAYDELLRRWPSSSLVPYALYGRGWSLLKAKDFAGAKTCFTTLLEKYPQHELAAESYFGRGMSGRQAGDAAGAVADIDAYLKTNPEGRSRSDAQFEKGLAQVALKQPAEASKTFAALLKEDPKYAAADRVLYELGWSCKEQGDEPTAARYFAQLAKEHPQSVLAAEAQFHVGEDAYNRKAYAESEKAYAAALAGASNAELAEKAAYKLGWSHYQQEHYADAESVFAAQVAKHPQGPLAVDGVFMRAESLFKQQKYQAALPVYTQARGLQATSPQMAVLVLLHGGQSATQTGQFAEGLEFLDAIPARFNDTPYLAEAYYEIGFARQKLGRAAEAADAYREAVTRSRGLAGARAQFMLGELAFEQKNYADAAKEFQRVMFRFGADQAPPEVKPWQARSGFEAARCAEVQIQDAASSTDRARLIADAKKFYTYVVEKHPDSELVAQARQRLDALSKL